MTNIDEFKTQGKEWEKSTSSSLENTNTQKDNPDRAYKVLVADLVAKCREEYFGIWPTLSSPVQVRIGILNQLNQEAITDIAGRFADAMLQMGASFNKEEVM